MTRRQREGHFLSKRARKSSFPRSSKNYLPNQEGDGGVGAPTWRIDRYSTGGYQSYGKKVGRQLEKGAKGIPGVRGLVRDGRRGGNSRTPFRA